MTFAEQIQTDLTMTHCQYIPGHKGCDQMAVCVLTTKLLFSAGLLSQLVPDTCRISEDATPLQKHCLDITTCYLQPHRQDAGVVGLEAKLCDNIRSAL